MTDDRAHILARLRDATGGSGSDTASDLDSGQTGPAGQAAVAARLSACAAGPVPARGRDPGAAARRERFIDEARRAGSHVVLVPCIEQTPDRAADYIRNNLPDCSGDKGGVPACLRLCDDPLLAGLTWPLPTRTGAVAVDDPVAISVPVAAIAETGTLVMASSLENPAMYGFMPDLHIAVLPAGRIYGHQEQVWSLLRRDHGRDYGQTFMPRSLNMITGPSRTADIEQTMLMGAHGPHSLLIMVVDGPDE